jgi:hypothetical protein
MQHLGNNSTLLQPSEKPVINFRKTESFPINDNMNQGQNAAKTATTSWHHPKLLPLCSAV